mmetsp:Transcript_14875/g.27908  ORF Transcript_14875/g.27908 Transcript_14875/m.27908 type:complete len:121 (+) Transcript_14875:63-425(+)
MRMRSIFAALRLLFWTAEASRGGHYAEIQLHAKDPIEMEVSKDPILDDDEDGGMITRQNEVLSSMGANLDDGEDDDRPPLKRQNEVLSKMGSGKDEDSEDDVDDDDEDVGLQRQNAFEIP